MLKRKIRNIANKFGYDFVKADSYAYGKRFKRKSDNEDLDYYETPKGNFYLPKGMESDIVANNIKEGKLFDEEIFKIVAEYVKPDTCILDVGANYGQMSVELSRMYPSCTVYSFEAQQMVYDILLKNIEANKAGNIKPFYNAVYNKSGLEFIFPVPDLKRFSSYGSYGLDLKATKGIPVTSIAIDSIDFEKPVSFMKVDIQGSDLAAMKGAVNTIAKYKMPVIFEYEEQFQEEFNTSFQAYVDFVAEIGYRFVKTVDSINYLIMPK